MQQIAGTYIWDIEQAPPAWKDRAHGITPAHGLALNGGPRRYAIEWEGGQTATHVQVGRAGSAVVVLCGAPRMRPNLPRRADLAAYIAQALTERQPIEPILATLDGEFLLLAWEAISGTAYLAVDPVGNHTLYYGFGSGGVIWSSHAFDVARRLGRPRIDREALNLYFDLKGIPAPWTLLTGVRKVRPGHVLQLTRDGYDEREYWPLARQLSRPYAGDFAAAQAELLQLLVATIQRYAEDVTAPIGVFLSGGLDSTALAALARHADVPVRAFTVGYTPAYHGDESAHARLAAERLGVPIEVCHFSPRDAADIATNILPRLPEPTAEPTLLPLLFLARRVAGPGQVVLDGTGADVIFAGTTKYTAEHYVRRYAQIPRPLRRRIIEPLSSRLPASRRWRLTNLVHKWQVFISMGALPVRERQITWTRFMPRPVIARLLAPEWLAAEDLGTHYLCEQLEQPGTGSVGAMSLMTLKGHTPWVELLKLHSLEQVTGISVRKPFLSPDLIEFGLCLPDNFKVRGNQGKVVLREACAALIPSGTLRRRKAIFATPISAWLNHDLRDLVWETLLHPTGLFDPAAIRRMLRQNDLGWRDWQFELWSIFVLQRWWIANAVK